MTVSDAQLSRSFTRAIRGISDDIAVNKLRDAIGRGDYQAALDAVDIEDAAFDDVRRLMLQAYAESAVDEVTGRKWPVPVRYNSVSPYAERYAREVVGNKITIITNDMRDAVRWTIGDGIAFGRSNQRIALDIAGRLGAGGSRIGGIVGLNRMQAQWVANARRYLESGDVASYLAMTRRDKRFDAIVKRGNLTPAQIAKITERYADRLLQTRALTIARTERGAAVNNGMIDAWRQAADKIGWPHASLVKEWRRGASREPRIWHVNQSVVGLDTPFMLATGVAMQCPHAPDAPASEVVNCNCRLRIKAPKGLRYG